MIPTHAAVFFRDKIEMTAELVNSLCGADLIHLYDNGSTENIVPLLNNSSSPLYLRWMPGLNLTQMWNHAWRETLEMVEGPVNLAILNNDISVDPHFLSTLSNQLRLNDHLWATTPETSLYGPDMNGKVHLVDDVGVSGMAGWAFMIKAEQWRDKTDLVNPDLQWWYGDNDIAAQITSSGHGIGLVEGLRCTHALSRTWEEHPELHPLTEQDRAVYIKRWGTYGLR